MLVGRCRLNVSFQNRGNQKMRLDYFACDAEEKGLCSAANTEQSRDWSGIRPGIGPGLVFSLHAIRDSLHFSYALEAFGFAAKHLDDGMSVLNV